MRLLVDPDTTACRLFNSATDGIDGLVIEKLGDVLIVQLHEGRLKLAESVVRQLCRQVVQRFNARAVYRKIFPRTRGSLSSRLDKAHREPIPWIGQPVESEFAVLENGIRLLAHPYDGYSTGIFLEHRLNRRRLRELAKNRRVLNAFAYTCGYAVAAELGGALATVNVDLSKKYLEWGKRNLAANRLSLDHQVFICADIFDYYHRAQRQKRSFEIIVLDPPTFARSKQPKRTFTLVADLDRLVAGAIALLEPGGLLLLCTNHRSTPERRLAEATTQAAVQFGRRCEIIARTQLPEDFQGDIGYAKSLFIRVG